jgi:hypothetical protein
VTVGIAKLSVIVETDEPAMLVRRPLKLKTKNKKTDLAAIPGIGTVTRSICLRLLIRDFP